VAYAANESREPRHRVGGNGLRVLQAPAFRSPPTAAMSFGFYTTYACARIRARDGGGVPSNEFTGDRAPQKGKRVAASRARTRAAGRKRRVTPILSSLANTQCAGVNGSRAMRALP
jgi:hypothetical protein